MHTTSHQPMRTARITTDEGCVIPRQRRGRNTERQQWLREQLELAR